MGLVRRCAMWLHVAAFARLQLCCRPRRRCDRAASCVHVYRCHLPLYGLLPCCATVQLRLRAHSVPAGDQIGRLLGWLESAGTPIQCEAPLLRGLRSMPLPWSAGSQPHALAGPELEPLRSDGYRTLVRGAVQRQ